MTVFPQGLKKYGQSPVFDHQSVPAKLTTSHKVKPGTWAKLVVHEGALDYVLAETPKQPIRVEAGSCAVIEPDVEHWVDIIGPVSFVVEFYRDEKEPQLRPVVQ